MNRGKSILGIHIDDDFLNIVHLGQTPQGLRVYRWAAEPLDVGAVENGLFADVEIIARKIHDFLKADKHKAHEVVMSPSCSAVRLMSSEYSIGTDEHLRKQIADEIKKYTLFGNQEIVFDYCIFSGSDIGSDKQTVLKAVATRQVGDACLNAAESAHLSLSEVEPAALPIVKLTYGELLREPDAVSVLLVLDSVSGSMFVFEGSTPRFCQNLTMGIKDICGDKDISSLTEEMKRVLAFANSVVHSGKSSIDLRIAVNSTGRKLKEVADRIESLLPDVTIKPIDSAQIAEQFDVQGADDEDLPILAFALTVTAMCESEYTGQLSLVSRESLIRQRAQTQVSLVAKVLVFVILLAVAAVSIFQTKTTRIVIASDVIEAEIIEAMPLKKKEADLKRQIQELTRQRSVYVKARESLTGIPWPRILHIIGGAIPGEVSMAAILPFNATDFKIVGETLHEENVYKFMKNLQAAELIENAKVEEIEYEDYDDYVLVNYRIICKIQSQEDDL